MSGNWVGCLLGAISDGQDDNGAGRQEERSGLLDCWYVSLIGSLLNGIVGVFLIYHSTCQHNLQNKIKYIFSFYKYGI